MKSLGSLCLDEYEYGDADGKSKRWSYHSTLADEVAGHGVGLRLLVRMPVSQTEGPIVRRPVSQKTSRPKDD